MAKALFGHVVAPAELRVVEENAVLRAKVCGPTKGKPMLRRMLMMGIAGALLLLSGNALATKFVRLGSVKMTWIVPDDWKVENRGQAVIAYERNRGATIAFAVLPRDLNSTAVEAEKTFAQQYTNYKTNSKTPGKINRVLR